VVAGTTAGAEEEMIAGGAVVGAETMGAIAEETTVAAGAGAVAMMGAVAVAPIMEDVEVVVTTMAALAAETTAGAVAVMAEMTDGSPAAIMSLGGGVWTIALGAAARQRTIQVRRRATAPVLRLEPEALTISSR
jgi:hypothetical protein